MGITLKLTRMVSIITAAGGQKYAPRLRALGLLA